jgi:hypothetical protein
MNNTTRHPNTVLLNQLSMIITLSGDDFDGLLNFSAVTLDNGHQTFYLDTRDTVGYEDIDYDEPSDPDSTGKPIFVLRSDFISDLAELTDSFEDNEQFSAEHSLIDLLADPNTLATTYLTLSDNKQENAANNANIARIQSIVVYNRLTDKVIATVYNEETVFSRGELITHFTQDLAFEREDDHLRFSVDTLDLDEANTLVAKFAHLRYVETHISDASYSSDEDEANNTNPWYVVDINLMLEEHTHFYIDAIEAIEAALKE